MPQMKEIDKLLRIVSRNAERVTKKVSIRTQEIAFKYLEQLELADGKIVESNKNKSVLNRLKKDIILYLKSAGIPEKMAKEVIQLYELMQTTIERINTTAGNDLPPSFVAAFRNYKPEAYKNLLGKMGESDKVMQESVRNALNKFAFAGRDFVALKNDLNDQSLKIKNSNTIAVTGAMTILNHGNEQVSEIAGFKNRIFLGPVDKLRRPFCKQFVNKVIDSEWVDKLKNGQGLPVRSNCGGYNCRHILIGTNDDLSWNSISEIPAKWRS